MKTTVLLLFLATAQVFAQIPPPTSGATNRFRNRPFSSTRPGGTAAPTPGNPVPTSPVQVAPGATTPAPNSAVTPAPGDQVIKPSANATNMAAEENIPAGMIDFRDASLAQVLSLYADLVNKTILRAANLGDPKITLTTKTSLTKTEARQALEATLGLNGIAIVQMGDKFAKASQLPAASAMGAEFSDVNSTNLPIMGQFITHVVQLHYVKPSELVQLLTPFSSGVPNAAFPIDSSQIIVLRDLTENVKRMLELIAKIDVSVPSEFESEVIPIKYAKAPDIANALNSLSTGGGGGASIGSSTGTRSTRSMGSSFGRTGSGAFGTSSGMGMGGMGYPGGNMPGSYGNPTTPQSTAQGTTGTSGNTFRDRLNSLVKAAGGTGANGEIQILGQTKMIADERSNSLLIYASHADMLIIKDIIRKLDTVLPQVLIESVIIEVDINNETDLGVSYVEKQFHPSSGYFSGIGAINNGNVFNPIISTATNAGSSFPGGFSYLAHLGGDLDVAVTAAANNSKARILQRPRIQTSHNEPATIFVGESRPYPTASYYGGGAYGGYSSIQQLEIGVTLEVTPLINPDGLVVMDIHQTIESANGTVNIVNVGDVPITSRKEAAAKVSVRDRDTIILGGLIETSKSKSASGVPWLKDIPILGAAFRTSTDKEVRNELIVLIRPTVLPTPEIAAQTAVAEKRAMPGVRATEREFRKEEAKGDRDAAKGDKDRQP